ncbi:MAG: NifB/NifX family molybdenum-iron cluster-binding protein [Marinifilaceae bacterium]|jgi:predicted Fe-Mo cluster-binding NifX family protein|nr:NifB/NifX family molybdenum-iron cluster-binding protein [Marinifilaceae bacterium]
MKNKIIAIPVKDNTLDPHFGHCSHFALFNIGEGQIQSTELLPAPPHEPGLLPRFLAEKGVTDVVAGGMGKRAIDLFNQRGVNVFVGAELKSAELLVHDYLNDSLTCKANYCDH